ncbi:MAG: amidohydrolase family protein [Chloroflexi bacterium]|nr:amidohydrolase family protein [Chloroflexota bacterium]
MPRQWRPAHRNPIPAHRDCQLAHRQSQRHRGPLVRHPIRVVATIDAHHHFWDTTRYQYPWMTAELDRIRRPFSPTDLQPHLAATDVVGTVLVQTRADLDETREFLRIAADNAFVCGVVGWVDLTDPAVTDVLGEIRTDKLAAIRHQVHDEADPEWLLRPDVRRGLAAVADAALVYDLLVRTRELPAAITVVREMPNARFVLDHLAKPPFVSGDLHAWAAEVRELARSENVVAKLSGLVTEADWKSWTPQTLQPAVDVALEAFGPQRLMFGSDWPVCLVAASYEQVHQTAQQLTAALSESERMEVFSQTAIRSYALTPPSL